MHQIAVASRPVALLSHAHKASWQPICAASYTPAKSKLLCNYEARLCLQLPCDFKQQTKRRLPGNCKLNRAQLNEDPADHTKPASSQRITKLLKVHQVAPCISTALVLFFSSSLERTLYDLFGILVVLVGFIYVDMLSSIAGSDTPAYGCTLGQSRCSFLVGCTWVKPLQTG